MKKYLLAGGLASVLVLGACGDDEPELSDDAVDTEQDAEQNNTAIDADNGDGESADDTNDQDEALDNEPDTDEEDSE